jgi:hypothetical protein
LCAFGVLLQVVERIVLEVELLLPLVRVALTCLSVDSLQLVQVQAVGEYGSLLAPSSCMFIAGMLYGSACR